MILDNTYHNTDYTEYVKQGSAEVGLCVKTHAILLALWPRHSICVLDSRSLTLPSLVPVVAPVRRAGGVTVKEVPSTTVSVVIAGLICHPRARRAWTRIVPLFLSLFSIMRQQANRAKVVLQPAHVSHRRQCVVRFPCSSVPTAANAADAFPMAIYDIYLGNLDPICSPSAIGVVGSCHVHEYVSTPVNFRIPRGHFPPIEAVHQAQRSEAPALPAFSSVSAAPAPETASFRRWRRGCQDDRQAEV
jgi:hypothetical protein